MTSQALTKMHYICLGLLRFVQLSLSARQACCLRVFSCLGGSSSSSSSSSSSLFHSLVIKQACLTAISSKCAKGLLRNCHTDPIPFPEVAISIISCVVQMQLHQHAVPVPHAVVLSLGKSRSCRRKVTRLLPSSLLYQAGVRARGCYMAHHYTSLAELVMVKHGCMQTPSASSI